MSVLVHAEVDGDRLSDDEIVQESLLILIGGDETTRHVISGGIHQLLLHPDQWERLADDPGARPAAVEEMLRWVTPIKNMVRTATRDVELRGQQIHEGDELMLLYPSANRDEDVFDDPFRFDSRPHAERARGLRVRHPLLPRRQPGPPRDRRDARRAARPHARTCASPTPTPSPSSAPSTSSAASSTSPSSGDRVARQTSALDGTSRAASISATESRRTDVAATQNQGWSAAKTLRASLAVFGPRRRSGYGGSARRAARSADVAVHGTRGRVDAVEAGGVAGEDAGLHLAA